jgi:hypothetical protein
VIVRTQDEDPNGLASMLADLIASNLERHPERRALLRSAVVGLTSLDAGVSATLRVERGGVRVANGPPAPAERAVLIGASAADLLALASAPLRAGVPDPTTAAGRSVLLGLARGRIRIRGALARPLVLPRIARLLSVR